METNIARNIMVYLAGEKQQAIQSQGESNRKNLLYYIKERVGKLGDILKGVQRYEFIGYLVGLRSINDGREYMDSKESLLASTRVRLLKT